jgi:hypothetical protein
MEEAKTKMERAKADQMSAKSEGDMLSAKKQEHWRHGNYSKAKKEADIASEELDAAKRKLSNGQREIWRKQRLHWLLWQVLKEVRVALKRL